MRLGLLLLISLLVLAGCGHDSTETPTHRATMHADVHLVQAVESARVLEIQGTIHATDDAVLSSRAMGPVVQEYVKVGDRVAKGQPLIEIEERMSQGQLAQARGALAQSQAALALAERNHGRFKSLFEKDACSQLELDLAVMQYEQAKGAVEQAEGAVAAAGAVAEESIIRSPFDAVVVEKMVSPGDLVAPGRPLIRVQSSSGREVWLTVRAADVQHFHRHDTLQIAINSLPDHEGMTAIVTEISPSGDPSTQTFLVKAILHDRQVPAGIGVTAFASGETEPSVFVPRHAIYRSGGLELVSVVDSSGHASTRAVTLGRTNGESVEILSGIVPGNSIVLHRTGPIAEGTKIQGPTE